MGLESRAIKLHGAPMSKSKAKQVPGMKPGYQRFTTSIRQDLHRELKIEAAKQGTTVSAILEGLVVEYLNRQQQN